jgi:hypothetical protein
MQRVTYAVAPALPSVFGESAAIAQNRIVRARVSMNDAADE